MVLPCQDICLVLQPDLGFDYSQEYIIFDLKTLVWRFKMIYAQYMQVTQVLEEEEEREELIRGSHVAQEATIIKRLA